MKSRLTKIKKPDLVIYVITVGILALLVLKNKLKDAELLMILLRPTALMVERALSISFDYHRGMGFYNSELAIIITGKCAGLNFFTALLGMLTFSFIAKVDRFWKKLIALGAFCIYAYILTILANASRIIGIVYMMNLGVFSNIRYENLLHQASGVVFYFTYFIIAYLLVDKLLKVMGDGKSEENI